MTAEEFGDIVVRANADGSLVRLKDVARIELGAENYTQQAFGNGRPATLAAASIRSPGRTRSMPPTGRRRPWRGSPSGSPATCRST